MARFLDEHKETVKYVHHDGEVSTFAETKGRHREFCLCHNHCKFFKPGEKDNCEIAQLNFSLCLAYNVTTPVIECPEFESEE